MLAVDLYAFSPERPHNLLPIKTGIVLGRVNEEVDTSARVFEVALETTLDPGAVRECTLWKIEDRPSPGSEGLQD